jgi:hypothetical protein
MAQLTHQGVVIWKAYTVARECQVEVVSYGGTPQSAGVKHTFKPGNVFYVSGGDSRIYMLRLNAQNGTGMSIPKNALLVIEVQ